MAEGNWKSSLFYCEQILKVDKEDIEAITTKAIVMYGMEKFGEMEQWLKKFPSYIMKNESLLYVRCKALEKNKNFGKIIQLIGGDTNGYQTTEPIVSIDDLQRIPRLLQVRDSALYFLNRTSDISSGVTCSLPLSIDSFNQDSIISLISRAMIFNESSLLHKYTVFPDDQVENDPLLLVCCGCFRILHNQIDSGQALLIKATELDPNCEIAWLCILYSFILLSEWDQGLSTLKRIQPRFSNSDNLALFAISLCLRSGSYSLGMNWIQKISIDNLFVRHEQAVVHLYEGEYQIAIKEFVKVENETNDIDIQASAAYNLGHCYRLLGMFNQAISSYERALSKGVKQSEAIASIGFSYHLSGAIDNAIIEYNKCLAIDPIHPFATKMLDLAIQNERHK